MNQERRSIVVVGAGPAGLTAARNLVDAGRDVLVLEKSRGVGGRTSTRRGASGARLDHGCQFVSRIGDCPSEDAAAWEAAGLSMRWDPRLSPGTKAPAFAGGHWSVGTPTMSAIAKHLGEGIEVRTGWRAVALEQVEAGWRIVSEQGGYIECEMLLITVPAPQAAVLLEPTGFEHQGLFADVAYDPVWALLLEGEAAPTLDYDAYGAEDEPLGWIAAQHSRPGRPDDPAWIGLAARAWSREHLEDDADSVRTVLLDSFSRITGVHPGDAGAVHRWRHAIVSRPLAQPMLVDATRRLVACGDWCLGPTIEHAVRSGQAAAEAIESSID